MDVGSMRDSGQVAEVEVLAKPVRRRFTVEYKRRILKEADSCKGS
jgi:hypothetical protein